MSTNHKSKGTSPSTSSIILPLVGRSRRGSLSSLAPSQVDKETLSQALDQIHNTASQSESLTTFDDFASPPPSSSGLEAKGMTGDIVHGGLSGLYSRFRASVGGAKEVVGGSPQSVEDGIKDNTSIKGFAPPTPSSNLAKGATIISSTTVSSPNAGASTTSRLQSPISAAFETALVNSQSPSQKGPKNPSNVKVSSSRASISSVLSHGMKSPTGPLTTATIPTVAQPAIAPVSVGAYKDAEVRSTETRSTVSQEEPLWQTFPEPEASGELSNSKSDVLESQGIPPLASATVFASIGQSEVRTLESRNHLPDSAGPALEYVRDDGDESTLTVIESVVDAKGKASQYSKPNISENGQSIPSNVAALGPPLKSKGLSRNPSNVASTNDANGITKHAIEAKPVMSPESIVSEITEQAALGQMVPEPALTAPSPLMTRISQSHLPGYKLSRASSSDVAEASITQIPLHIRMDNRNQKVGPEPTLNSLGRKDVSKPAKNGINLEAGNAGLDKLRSKVLSKDFWMRDENAKDCFYCGDTFSTWRRKHHCRTCGQIFDAKCTMLVPGKSFGHSGHLRVCKPCEAIINGYDDESSDMSADETVLRTSFFTPSTTTDPAPTGNTLKSASPDQDHQHLSTPMMAIPATRRTGDGSNHRSAILEINPDQSFLRPTSSRSLKTAMVGRPHSSNHKRHPSRHQHVKGFRSSYEERAPFHRNPAEDLRKQTRLLAFHKDSIIDPDLAPFMSDEGSSGDEQMSIFEAMNGEGLASGNEGERNAFGGLLAAVKKGRSKLSEKALGGLSFAGRDADEMSITSSKADYQPRSLRKRNLSVNSHGQMRPSPRAIKSSSHLRGIEPSFQDSLNGLPEGLQGLGSTVVNGSRMTRSASMRGQDAPAIELNNASLQHVRKLLRQLLQDSEIASIGRWEKALMPILLQCTDDVNPDVQQGDEIDVRHYVKLKRVPGGRPCDTSYVSGVVFSKNLALKSMPRTIPHPKIIIITFPIEYTRHQQHFMSLEPVIAQEREFLENLVNRIAALRPQLLLVQRNVSGLALQFLAGANIATAYNVKPSVITAIARCTQTKIISSIDKLAIKPVQVGKCASFDLKTYVHPDIPGRKKTYIYLSGCPKELGCTVVLRGANLKTLAKLKRITEFMVYIVYNLKLETCLMRDEFVLIPSITNGGELLPGKETAAKAAHAAHAVLAPPIDVIAEVTNKLHEHEKNVAQASADVSNADVMKAPLSDKGPFPRSDQPEKGSNDEVHMPEDIPMPTFYGDMVEKHQTKILSASPFVKFMQPYLLMRAREQERRLVYLKRLRDQDISFEEQTSEDKLKPQKFDLIRPEMVHETIEGASKKVREVLHAVHDAEYDKALHNYQTQSRQWETYIASNINLFDPYAHQNIVVLYSVVCTITTIPCSGPDLLALAFYNEHETDEDFVADCTLGQYVEDLCLGANTVCTANSCERKMFDHHRQYVHGEARICAFVQHYPCKMRGMQNTILMWSCCRICGQETQVMPMSESTWKYSFGKYLELSFWSSELHPRAGICPHDLHRNHIRYFGYKDVAVRIHYDPINLFEIIVPRTRITWKVDNDLRLKNEQFGKIEERLDRFMLSVKARITSINGESVLPEKAEACKLEIERLSKRAHDEHLFLTHKLQDKYMNSNYYEVVPLNRAIRAVQEKVANWDAAFADFDRNFFPSEKDIRRLAALQLKKIFLDRDQSVSSVTSTEEGIPEVPLSEVDLSEQSLSNESLALAPKPTQMSPEKTHDVLTSVIEEQTGTTTTVEHQEHEDAQGDTTPTPTPLPTPGHTDKSLLVESSLQGLSRGDVRHLDLAIASRFPERRLSSQESSALGSVPVSPTTTRDSKIPDPSPMLMPTTLDPTITDKMEEMQSNNRDNSSTREHSQDTNPPRFLNPSHRAALAASPPLFRTQSQPAHIHREQSINNSSDTLAPLPRPATLSSNDPNKTISEPLKASVTDTAMHGGERKLSERLGLGAPKPARKFTGHSLIPRSVPSKRKDSRVSTLAKHFEQLSREFEKERLRERRLRAAKNKQARAYPMASSKPIVEIYRNVHEAVEEREPSDDDLNTAEPPRASMESSERTDSGATDNSETAVPRASSDDVHAGDTAAEATETDENAPTTSQAASDAEGEGDAEGSDMEHSLPDDIQIPGSTEASHILSPSESQLDLKLDLPKHEKSSLMKMLTNFWAERSASGWTALEYPLNASDHIFADSDIIIREDEPSSLIAFALGSEDYMAKLRSIRGRGDGPSGEYEKQHSPIINPQSDNQVEVERSLLRSTGTHLKYQFQEGSAKMLCKIFYAEQFDAVRRKCGVSDRIVESLSRCAKWDSKGGKTRSVFLKTMDDRLVLKSLQPVETQAFLRFAPAYFQIMSETLFHELPSVIAKMLGFYQIVIKNPITGVEIKWDVLIMENLFYDRNPTRTFDLKGSMRNRKIQSTGEQNEVLLDENMVEFIYESPLFAREHSKKLLRASVWNDTLFLARQNVMDYSLMIAIDEVRKELVVGIIDCIRTYTWDKKLESWIKIRGFAGGNKNQPTVTSPKEYKSRFREAMARYVLQAPNCWHQFQAQQIERRPLKIDGKFENKDGDRSEVEVDVVGL
ncbi:MAG: 1-phosphatidylinositol-3-phosphate 5-kinase [Pycnora praestabilis]|nr:MAG: 1-phosphatidylinositol-3-phosphate 5-kinase [Pycnora praestabilis]